MRHTGSRRVKIVLNTPNPNLGDPPCIGWLDHGPFQPFHPFEPLTRGTTGTDQMEPVD